MLVFVGIRVRGVIVIAMVVIFAASCVAPADPIGAVGAVLAFPDRHPRFDRVDQPPATGGMIATSSLSRTGSSHAA